MSVGGVTEEDSREHLFRECTAWTKGVCELWTAVGEASGGYGGNHFKCRKGFGFRVRLAKARPSNTSIRDLLSDDRYTEAVFWFSWGNASRGGQGGRYL